MRIDEKIPEFYAVEVWVQHSLGDYVDVVEYYDDEKEAIRRARKLMKGMAKEANEYIKEHKEENAGMYLDIEEGDIIKVRNKEFKECFRILADYDKEKDEWTTDEW